MNAPEHASLAEALAGFQAELPHVDKENRATIRSDKGMSFTYSYADLADLSPKVLPLLAKHGLSFSAKPTLDDTGRFVLVYTLRHVSGESDGGVYPLGSGTPQQVGSLITYARRYALLAVTGVAPGGEDDDGQAAEQAANARDDLTSVTEAQAARNELREFCRKNGVDMKAVVGAYAQLNDGAVLGDDENAARVQAFTALLMLDPHAVLNPISREEVKT